MAMLLGCSATQILVHRWNSSRIERVEAYIFVFGAEPLCVLAVRAGVPALCERNDLARVQGGSPRYGALKSSRLKVPSSRFDLSITGMCGAILASLTSQSRLAPEP